MEKIKEFLESHDNKCFFYMLLGFLIGIVVGLVISPVRKGITMFSYNGCNNEIRDNGRNNSSENSKTIEKRNK